jgi:photosystem II stability/assembly factor-like uncharacterized protein
VIALPPPSTAVALVDRRHGWVGGSGGLVGTRDGTTFTVQLKAPVIGISALDRRRAWAITGDGFVLRTSNGRRWVRLGAPHLVRVQFVDARVGFGLTRDGLLVRSGDAGLSWPSARAPGLVQAECFGNRRDGWLARGGSVWSTHDGGRRWVRTRLRAGPRDVPELGCRGTEAWVAFHEGAAAGTEGYRVYRSGDGGATWRAVLASPFQLRLPSVSNYLGPFAVLGRGRAVFSGWCSPCEGFGTLTIARTLDGGASFHRTTSLRGYTPQALAFTDANDGWLVTGAHAGSAAAPRIGVLWRTRDGGRTWRLAFRSPLLAP